jgi:hypothetical protein
MNWKLVTTVFTISAIASINITSTANRVKAQEQTQEQVQFVCASSFDKTKNERYPTTFAWTTRGKIAVLRWVSSMGSNFTPQNRCEKVSPRFQEAYNSGTLGLLTNGERNGQPVICTAREYGGSCDTLLMTLRPGDNSFLILNELKDIFSGRQVGPVIHNSGTRKAYVDIDFQEFLRNAPVEKE